MRNERCPVTQDPLVSIIVPVYKVEKYLRRCLNSIVDQTYLKTEVLLVDDGSPDHCGEICDEYSAKYTNITVIHQENQGQAAARNHAAIKATGDYIAFIDSDDYVESDYVEYLMGLVRQYNADIAIGGFRYLYEGTECPPRKAESVELLMSTEEALNRLNYTKGYGAAPWAKLYRRQLILDHPFPEGQIYEDLAVLYRIFCDADRVAYGNRVIYYWLQRAGSTMRSEFSDRQMAALRATEDQIWFLEEKLPSAIPSARARHEAKIVELMAVAMESSNSRSAYKTLKRKSRFFREVLKDKNVSVSMKMRMVSIRAGYLPARAVFHIHETLKRKALS